jgi:hypothetical protein
MTKHRQEAERILSEKLSKFDETLQAAIRRSDQSYLAAALTLNSATTSDELKAISATEKTPSLANTTLNYIGDPNAAGQAIVDRGAVEAIDLSKYSFDPNKLALEPTIVNEQLNRYLQHLNELRRVNEGDDTSDSPGYALNLIRLPISVLPGKMTRTGYGAEISFTATPYLSDDLLPETMRSLIINDIVNLNSLPVAKYLLDDPARAKEDLRQLRSNDVRVTSWYHGLGTWIDHLASGVVDLNDPRQADLARNVAFLHSHRVYLHNRLMQFAIPVSQQQACDFEPKKIADFAFSARITQSGLNHTVGVTYRDLGEWLNLLASDAVLNPENVTKKRPLKLYVWACKQQSFGPGYVFQVGLKNRDEELGDISRTRSVPLNIDWPVEVTRLFVDYLTKQAKQARRSTSPEVLPPGTTPEEAASAATADQGALALPTMSTFKELIPAIQGQILEYMGPGTVSNQLNQLALDAFGLPLFDDVVQTPGYSVRPKQVERALAPSQYLPVYGVGNFYQLVSKAEETLYRQAAADRVLTILDVRNYLQEEAATAYRWLEQPENIHLWTEHCTPFLARAIASRDYMTINRARDEFMRGALVTTERSEVAALAWGIIVDASRLNERLIEDMRHIAQSKGCDCVCGDGMLFVGPASLTSPEALEAFKQYVNCRWPIQVFALDPVTQDQNVADIFNRRREMQLALAAGVAKGTVTAGAAMRWVRRLETDIETIALNRTAVGFSHGADSFGWRFYPRVQSPDTPGTLGALGQTLAGGPRRDHDVRDRQLEPGIRECVAVIVMPSFVPYVTFESRGSWFGLTNPSKRVLTMHDTMKISRNYQEIRRDLQTISESCVYRPGDVSHLTSVVEQMERKLPLQTSLVPIPFENTLGGFEMFSTGVTDLAPELYGWYGAPGVFVGGDFPACATGVDFGVAQCQSTCKSTTLFLVGGRFSVHDTKVIAGGKCVPYQLISREIMRVSIPNDAQPITDANAKREYVDVHIATPYGVTSHMLIPALQIKKEENTLAATVAAQGKQIAALQSAAVTFGAGSQQLEFAAVCHPTNAGGLNFIPQTTSDLTLTFQIPAPIAINQKVKMAVRVNDKFLGDGFDSKLTLPIDGSRPVSIPIVNIADEINARLVKGGITSAAFKDGKLAAQVWVYYENPASADVRFLGAIPLQVTLACPCCGASAPARGQPETLPAPSASGAATPAQVSLVTAGCNCELPEPSILVQQGP